MNRYLRWFNTRYSKRTEVSLINQEDRWFLYKSDTYSRIGLSFIYLAHYHTKKECNDYDKYKLNGPKLIYGRAMGLMELDHCKLCEEKIPEKLLVTYNLIKG